MVITIEVANFVVLKTLVDQGSSVDILYWKTLKRLGLAKDTIVPMEEQIVAFSSKRVDTRGYIDLYTKFGEGDQGYRTIMVRNLFIDVSTSYNVLLEWPSLNNLGVIESTPHLAMKLPLKRGGVTIVHVNQKPPESVTPLTWCWHQP